MSLNPGLLVSVHCYSGDAGQCHMLMPWFEHHQSPLVFCSPTDKPVTGMKHHMCLHDGTAGHIGAHTWERQRLQMERLLTLGNECRWFLLNDADSLCLKPKLPAYLFEDENVVWGNYVDDFRKPGQSWNGQPPWPLDYHAGYPGAALQPPYIMSRSAMIKMCKALVGIEVCPITPFIDWAFVKAPIDAGLRIRGFRDGVSCSTTGPNGRAIAARHVRDNGAIFIHSVKERGGLNAMLSARAARLAKHPEER